MYLSLKIKPIIKSGIELKIMKACGEIFIKIKRKETINKLDNIKVLILSIFLSNI